MKNNKVNIRKKHRSLVCTHNRQLPLRKEFSNLNPSPLCTNAVVGRSSLLRVCNISVDDVKINVKYMFKPWMKDLVHDHHSCL